MKFSTASIAIAIAASAASAATFGNNTVTTLTIPIEVTSTSTVLEYTTYCPEPTTITEGTKTIVVTEAGTITITDCPCTRTTTHTTTTVTECPVTDGTPVIPTDIKPVPTNGTVSSTHVPPSQTLPQGNAAAVGVSGALAGVAALVAYVL